MDDVSYTDSQQSSDFVGTVNFDFEKRMPTISYSTPDRGRAEGAVVVLRQAVWTSNDLFRSG